MKWDVGSPRSVRPVSPTKYECRTLSPSPSGGMIGGWPGWSGVVPPGRIHAAASLKSLSRQLLSFHLGSLPRVAAREMGEVVGTGEMMFQEQLNFCLWLTVLHYDAELPGIMGRFSHFSASVGLLCLGTRQKLTEFPISITCYQFLKLWPSELGINNLALLKRREIILPGVDRSRELQTLGFLVSVTFV